MQIKRTAVLGISTALVAVLVLSSCAGSELNMQMQDQSSTAGGDRRHRPLYAAECASRYEFRLTSIRSDAEDNFGVFNQRISAAEARSVLRDSDLESITLFTTQGEIVVRHPTCLELRRSIVGATLLAPAPPTLFGALIFPVRIDLNNCEWTHRSIGKWEAYMYATLSANGLFLLEGDSQPRAYAIADGEVFQQTLNALGLSLVK